LSQLKRRDERRRKKRIERIQASEGTQEPDNRFERWIFSRFRANDGCAADTGLSGDLFDGTVLAQPVRFQPGTQLSQEIFG
jgi:hypothetical protein